MPNKNSRHAGGLPSMPGKNNSEIERLRRELAESQKALAAATHGWRASIAERELTRDTLSKEQVERDAILNSLLELVVYQDLDMKVVWANKAACDSVNSNFKELVGRHCYDIWHHRTAPCDNCPVRKAAQTGLPHSEEVLSPDGRWWFIQGYPVRDNKGNLAGLVELTLEITERKRAEKELSESIERVQAIIEQMPYPVQVYGRDGLLLMANKALLDFFGLPSLEMLLGRFNVYTEPFMKGHKIEERFGKVFAGETIYMPEAKFDLSKLKSRFGIDRQGVAYQDIIVFPVFAKTGEVTYAVAIFKDITDRILAEQALRDSEEMYRSLLDASPDAVTACDLQGIITQVSMRACQLHGTEDPHDLIGKNALDMIAPEDRERAAINMQKTMETGFLRSAVYTMVRKDGSRFVAELDASVIRDSRDAPAGFVAAMRDITERTMAQKALKESEENFRSLADQSPNIIFINNMGRILYVNKLGEEIMGYSREEFYSPQFNFLSLTAPGYEDLIKQCPVNRM